MAAQIAASNQHLPSGNDSSLEIRPSPQPGSPDAAGRDGQRRDGLRTLRGGRPVPSAGRSLGGKASCRRAPRRLAQGQEKGLTFEQLRHFLSRVQRDPDLKRQVEEARIDHPGEYPGRYY